MSKALSLRRNLRYFSIARRTVQRRVETLNPAKFESKGQEPLNLRTAGGKSCPSVHVTLGGTPKISLLSYQRSKDKGTSGFPPNSVGYLYFRPPSPNHPRITGELRFRLATALEEFERGEDLKLPSGEPWRRPLFTLTPGASHKPFYDKLVEEGLVNQDVDRVVAEFCTTAGVPSFLRAWRYDWNVLYSLSDPFDVDFTYADHHMRGLTHTGIMHFMWPFMPFRRPGENYTVYPSSGRVRLRFEPSTLPEHVGKRIVVIRVVEILEPIRFWSAEKNEEKPLLQVGELVPSEGVYDSPPLCFNLDGPKPYRSGVNKIVRLLQLLWQGDPLLKKTTTSTGTEPVQSPAVFHTSQAWANWTTRLVKTLDPRKLREKSQMPLDLAAHPSDHFFYWTGLKILPSSNKTKSQPSPSRLRGYLYFRTAQPDRPQISGDLRFRLAETPEDFATGQNLTLPNGNTWSRPLFSLAKWLPNRYLFGKVLEDGLISKEMHRSIDSLLDSRGMSVYPAYQESTVLYTLSDPFVVDLSAGLTGRQIWGITDADSLSGTLPPLFVDYLKCGWCSRYKGSLRIRFEPSSLPEHTGKPIAVLRILDILDSIELNNNHRDYEGSLPPPKAGELVLKRGEDGVLKALSFNLEGEVQRPKRARLSYYPIENVLRHLWDEDAKRGSVPSRPATSS